MIEVLAVTRFIRSLVASDDLLSAEIPGGVVAFGEDGIDEDERCGEGKAGLPRVISLSQMTGQDTNSLGPDRAFSDISLLIRVYGQSGERFADIKPLANRLDALLQGAHQAAIDPRFFVERTQQVMDREQDGPNVYAYIGGQYRFLITPEAPAEG